MLYRFSREMFTPPQPLERWGEAGGVKHHHSFARKMTALSYPERQVAFTRFANRTPFASSTNEMSKRTLFEKGERRYEWLFVPLTLISL